jgi:peptidylprolyl isomerase
MKKILFAVFIYMVAFQAEGYAQFRKKKKKEGSKEKTVPVKKDSVVWESPLKPNQSHTTSSGLKITLIREGKGFPPKMNDLVIAHYNLKLANDSVVQNSWMTGEPVKFRLGANQVIAAWEEAFTILRKGDMAELFVPAALGYGDRWAGRIPPKSDLKFTVEVVDIASSPIPFDVKGRDTVKTASGLKYVIIGMGEGEKPKVRDHVNFHFTGWLPDGRMFDSSVDRGSPVSIELGRGNVLMGWEEAFKLFPKNTVFKLIVPYQLALGEAGHPPQIPPKTDLIFDIIITDIIPANIPVPYDVSGKPQVNTKSGLQYYIADHGSGIKAEKGKYVTIHYTTYFEDGKIFDSSVERGAPKEFQLGIGSEIKGMEEGIENMKVGARFRLVIPYKLAYGEKGYPFGGIPEKTNLVVDVELLHVSD